MNESYTDDDDSLLYEKVKVHLVRYSYTSCFRHSMRAGLNNLINELLKLIRYLKTRNMGLQIYSST